MFENGTEQILNWNNGYLGASPPVIVGDQVFAIQKPQPQLGWGYWGLINVTQGAFAPLGSKTKILPKFFQKMKICGTLFGVDLRGKNPLSKFKDLTFPPFLTANNLLSRGLTK
ncbi:MAG: hypothetical protein H0A76_12780 [Candidatus Thiodubiliella endoseptemdiera]|uniref:Uncharacterized protein n=1 Tax=Candidatus Thiodubiliella endoseptemdiera TaxID=2738886 RepID=A0A853FAK1_9GAMM|nr:hypothetical protein [Candidatus Thiodubiliella endoseptemdiera]